MQKIDLTPELGLKIKELRLKHHIKAKDLANFLEKSPAYISKLENGEIKQIEHSVFKTMINFITGDENGYNNFMTIVSENISSEALEDSLLFYNFDWIERNIPVPEELIDYIKNKMSELNINSTELVDYINKNEDLDDNFFIENSMVKSEFKENVWHSVNKEITDKDDTRFFILLNYSEQQLSNLLTKQIEKTNYTFIFAIVYHLLKYENLCLDKKQSDDILKSQTTDIINSYKFYSITDRKGFLEKSKSKEEFDELLSKFDRENMRLINELLSSLQFISDLDVKYANEKLSQIVDNMQPNPGFALGFMALPLRELINVGKDVRKEFIEEVKHLIEIYKNKTDITVEKY